MAWCLIGAKPLFEAMMTYRKLYYKNTFSRNIIWKSNVFILENALLNMGQVTEPRPSCYLALLSGDNKTRQQRRQPQLRDLTNIVCEKGAFLFRPHICLLVPAIATRAICPTGYICAETIVSCQPCHNNNRNAITDIDNIYWCLLWNNWTR